MFDILENAKEMSADAHRCRTHADQQLQRQAPLNEVLHHQADQCNTLQHLTAYDDIEMPKGLSLIHI